MGVPVILDKEAIAAIAAEVVRQLDVDAIATAVATKLVTLTGSVGAWPAD